MNANAKPFVFSSGAPAFTPSVAPQIVAKAEPDPQPVVQKQPEPAPTSEVADWETQPAKLDLEVADIDDAALLEELKNNPELQAELAAIEKAEAAEKAAAAARHAAKKQASIDRKAAAAAAKEASLTKVDEREHLNIVFIGHVDAGKSTISGQIMLATGQVDERTIAKYKKEAEEKNRDSWYLAFIMDSNEEEKAKGKTVEVGRAHFVTNNKRYTLLDAPGHKNYVPNMIGGAQQADVGVLVISARRGEFETGFDRGGQTREHAMLAKTLGIKRLIILVNKMDEKTVLWEQERFDAIETKLSPFLKKCGFNLKKEVTYCPISGYTGANIKDRFTGCDWYNGPSFLEILDKLPPLSRDVNAPARIPIITRFKDMGSLWILGKLEAGTIRKGDRMTIMPLERDVTVKGILVDEEEVDIVTAGENTLIKISGVEEDDINEGMVLCSAVRCALRTNSFNAQIQVMDLLQHKPLLTAGYLAVLHIHSLIVECEVALLLEDLTNIKPVKGKKVKKGKGKKGKGKKGKKGKKSKAAAEPVPEPARPKGPRPRMLRTGNSAIVRINTPTLICVEKFCDQPAMGRFTLRDEGITIAIGKITAVKQGLGSTVKR